MLENLIESVQAWFATYILNSPLFQINSSWLQVDPWLFFVLIVIATAAFLAATITWGIRAHPRRILAGREELIGKTAEVKTVMNPKGAVLIQGELWTAILDAGRAVPGDEVVITKVDNLMVSVTKSKATVKSNYKKVRPIPRLKARHDTVR